MTVVPPTLTRLRRIALAALLLILAVTTLSAYMRLANAGLGCADWPACYGQLLAGEPRYAAVLAQVRAEEVGDAIGDAPAEGAVGG